MSSQLTWNRRTFVSALGLTVAAAAAPAIGEGRRPQSQEPSGTGQSILAFTAFSSPGDRSVDRIESYRVGGGKWSTAGAPVPCESVSSLALHPKLAVLYVAHSTALHGGLPRGSVSAIGFDSASGDLQLLSRQALSLSATNPKHLAVSPDGRILLVSASGGGAYNFFSLAADGIVLATPDALKQTGSGPHPLQAAASPHSAVFHRSGSAAYATDLGSDRISHIAFDRDLPSIRSRVSFVPGSGPAHVVHHPSGELLVVTSRLRPGLTVIPIDAKSGNLLSPIGHFAVDAELGGPLAMSDSGDHVYLASIAHSGDSTVSVFRLARSTGRLRLVQQTPIPKFLNPEQLTRVDDQLLLVGTGGVVSLTLDKGTGLIAGSMVALKEPSAVSVAIRML
jgi:6-phosphogluconolactonase